MSRTPIAFTAVVTHVQQPASIFFSFLTNHARRAHPRLLSGIYLWRESKGPEGGGGGEETEKAKGGGRSVSVSVPQHLRNKRGVGCTLSSGCTVLCARATTATTEKKAGTVFVGRAVFDFACLDGRTRRNIIQIGTRGKEENGRRGGGRHTRKQEVKGEAEEGQEEKRGGGPNE